jgi:hypothetical protein
MIRCYLQNRNKTPIQRNVKSEVAMDIYSFFEGLKGLVKAN